MKFLFLLCAFVFLSCTSSNFLKAKVTKIGSQLPSRSSNCDIDILKGDEVPTRPYVEIGMVTLDHCQNFSEDPCKKRLVKEACKLGGKIAYLAEKQNHNDGRPDNSVNAMSCTVMIAVFVVDLVPNTKKDLISNSPKPDCNDPKTSENVDNPMPEKCLE